MRGGRCSSVGQNSPEWFLDPDLALLMVIIVYIWKNQGYCAVIFLAVLQSIPNDLLEAAAIDRAGAVRTFFKVTLPLLSPTMLFILITSILSSMQAFDVLRIMIPPLRDRREDIGALVDHYWRDTTTQVGSRATLSASTVAALARYDWPGNVRELQNVLAALAIRSPKRGVIPPTALPPAFVARADVEGWRLEEARRTFEERFIRAALVRSGGHRARAASELGVTRQGLTKLMRRLGIADQ